MTKAKPATFPFDFIVLWIRPNTEVDAECMFCKGIPAEYEHYHYVDMRDMLTHGMDTAWMKAISQQTRGNYAAAYYQPVCLDCCIHFAAIQLGKKRPLQELLTLASLTRKQ